MLQVIKHITQLFLVVITCITCTEKDLVIDFPSEPEKIVCLGKLSSNAPVTVSLASTQAIDKQSFTMDGFALDSATVLLFEGGTVVDSFLNAGFDFRYNEYISSTNYLPKPDQDYHLEISAPGYTPVSSDPIKLPPVAAIQTLEVEGDSLSSLVNVHFKMDSIDLDRYMYFADIVGQTVSPFTMQDTTIYLGTTIIKRSLKPSDEISIREVRIKPPKDIPPYDGIFLKVTTFSTEFKDYHDTTDDNEDASGNIYTPHIRVTTNFTNGYGIFYGCSTRRWEISR